MDPELVSTVTKYPPIGRMLLTREAEARAKRRFDLSYFLGQGESCLQHDGTSMPAYRRGVGWTWASVI